MRYQYPQSYVRFIILSGARTGSNMLASALDGSPNIVCFRETFNTRVDHIDFHVDGYDDDSAEDRALRDSDFREFLRRRIFCDHGGRVQAVGFKMPHTQFWAFPGLLEWLVDDTDLRVLHLKRRNLLRMLVSLRIAQETGFWVDARERRLRRRLVGASMRTADRLWGLFSPTRAPWRSPRPRLVLAEVECREFFDRVEQDDAAYAHRFGDHQQLALYYEDLVNDQEETLSQVQDFLGVAPGRLAPTTRRQNPEPLAELIENYDELYKAFKSTPHASFFD